MPTIQGMRRRGYRPDGIREFARRIGVSKSSNNVDMAIMEGAIREDLENVAPRVVAVINPLRVTITNYDGALTRAADFHPNRPELGSRMVAFSANLFIEADDFAEVPPAGWKRLTLGGEVRLRHSYVMRCDEAVKDESGKIIELRCSIDHATLGKNPEGRKVKGVIHFLSCSHALPAEIRLYDRLFTVASPDADKDVDFCNYLNPDSLKVVQGWVEVAVQHSAPETHYQFERLGYFCTDRRDHKNAKLVFNRTVTLKDTWSKS
jgi:glutaminyl-tRNA synthetase